MERNIFFTFPHKWRLCVRNCLMGVDIDSTDNHRWEERVNYAKGLHTMKGRGGNLDTRRNYSPLYIIYK